MSDNPLPSPRRKPNLIRSIVVGIFGIAAIVGGISQMKNGLKGMKGDPEVDRLALESDTAFHQANKHLAEAAPVFQAMLESVDSDGLEAVRSGKKDEATKAATLLAQAAELLRQSAQKALDAAALKPPGKMEAFLETKAEAYRDFAAACDINKDIAHMVLDESIKTGEELIPKVQEAAARRDKLELTANEAVARADKLVTESKK